MANEKTITNLKEMKVNAVIGKKKHFNAANRKLWYFNVTTVSILIINAVVGVLLFAVLITEELLLKYISLILAAIGTVLSGVQIKCNFYKISEGHRAIGNRYLSTYRKCKRTEGYIEDGQLKENIPETIEEIAEELDNIDTEAQTFPTNEKDYEKSQEGIESGEEDYTDKELNL